MLKTVFTTLVLLSTLAAAQTVPFKDGESLPAGEYTVFRVLDADTITILVAPPANPTASGGAVSGGAPVEPVERSIRLAEINTPEMRPLQPFAQAATDFARDLLTETTVKLMPTVVDRYGRQVAYVVLPDGRELGIVLAQAGLAGLYDGEPSPVTPLYKAAVAGARASKKGMYVDAPDSRRKWRCSSFGTQAEATVFLAGSATEADADPFGLDRNGNQKACEKLPRGGNPLPFELPSS